MVKMVHRPTEVQAVEVSSIDALAGFPGVKSVAHHCQDVPGCRLLTVTTEEPLEPETVLVSLGQALVYFPGRTDYEYYDSWEGVIRNFNPVEVDEPLESSGWTQLAFDLSL